jgi:hypothetical protein
MTLLIQDTARNNLAGWTERALAGGYASGAIMSPFTSPVQGNGYKVDAVQTIGRIRDAGGEPWFDPQTHALQMPHVGDFRYYDEWQLWQSQRNDLTTEAAQRTHAERVFEIQAGLEVPLLSPTILLSSPSGLLAQLSADLAAVARSAGGERVWISIAGDAQFWASGIELDALVGRLDQLQPAGWYLTVARPTSAIPVGVDPREVFGLARTALALSSDRPVVIGHGDLSALPAFAAGASAIGSGWDVRQRVLGYSDYVERASEDTQGRWFARPTMEGLLGVIPRSVYEVVHNESQAFANSITPGRVGERPEEAFAHHARTLTGFMRQLNPLGPKERVGELLSWYRSAEANWGRVAAITGATIGSRQWVDPFAAGLQLLQDEEGW